MNKYNIEQIREQFYEAGYLLKSKEYINRDVHLDCVCTKGHEWKVTRRQFQNGRRCSYCEGNNLHPVEVRDYFTEQGCVLLEDYRNTRTPMRYICVCGNESKINFYSFRKGHRCMKCATAIKLTIRKLPFEYVKSYFDKQGCKLISETYINSKLRLKYICLCGNKGHTTWNSFQQGVRCDFCAKQKIADSKRLDYQDVKNYFENQGCKLLDTTYVDTDTRMNYICVCGEEWSTLFGNFQQGCRCGRCKIERMSGENSPAWAGGISPLYQYLRNKLDKWRKDVLNKYDYKCAITNEKTEILAVHHIHPFHLIVKEVLLELNIDIRPDIGKYTTIELNDITNLFLSKHTVEIGVPMIPELHWKFHSTYGYDNTEEQFLEFKDNVINKKIELND